MPAGTAKSRSARALDRCRRSIVDAPSQRGKRARRLTHRHRRGERQPADPAVRLEPDEPGVAQARGATCRVAGEPVQSRPGQQRRQPEPRPWVAPWQQIVTVIAQHPGRGERRSIRDSGGPLAHERRPQDDPGGHDAEHEQQEHADHGHRCLPALGCSPVHPFRVVDTYVSMHARGVPAVCQSASSIPPRETRSCANLSGTNGNDHDHRQHHAQARSLPQPASRALPRAGTCRPHRACARPDHAAVGAARAAAPRGRPRRPARALLRLRRRPADADARSSTPPPSAAWSCARRTPTTAAAGASP